MKIINEVAVSIAENKLRTAAEQTQGKRAWLRRIRKLIAAF
jgi:hypothetical protein